MLATRAVAGAGPTPGIPSSRRLASSDRCQALIMRSNCSICTFSIRSWAPRGSEDRRLFQFGLRANLIYLSSANSAGSVSNEIMSNVASGRQLKAARTLAGLTQSELSTEAGFNPRACRYWEGRGDDPPTNVPSTLDAVEAVLLRNGVQLFCNPTPGCRLVSTK